MTTRYGIVRDPTGHYSVIDAATGDIACLDGICLKTLALEGTNDLADLLSALEAKAAREERH